MTPEQLDEIEKRWAGYLKKNEVERRFLFAQWWDKRDFWDMSKALREAWKDREDYRNDAIAAEQECDRMLTSTALLTYLVEELVKAPRNGNRIEKLVEQSRAHLLRLREYEGSDE